MGFRKSLNRLKNRKINERAAWELNFIKSLAKSGKGKIDDVLEIIPHSKSQYYQDILVLYMLDFKQKGYFVEFGADDGISLSNTYLLEKEFCWNGILAEPSKGSHNTLVQNRDVNIDFDCVWHSSNEMVEFWELKIGSLSGISTGFKNMGRRLKKRKEYTVNTVSLNDLLERYSAPHEIDYLSIDTEGTELEILETFDFSKHSFSVITVEHNFSADRNGQYDLLSKNGYKRILENISLIDDWYVRC